MKLEMRYKNFAPVFGGQRVAVLKAFEVVHFNVSCRHEVSWADATSAVMLASVGAAQGGKLSSFRQNTDEWCEFP